MTDYHIFLNDSLKISDSINTQVDFVRILNDLVIFITSLGGLISWVIMQNLYVKFAGFHYTNMIEDY